MSQEVSRTSYRMDLLVGDCVGPLCRNVSNETGQ